MFKILYAPLLVCMAMLAVFACKNEPQKDARLYAESHQEMVNILSEVRQKLENHQNGFSAEAKIAYFDSLLNKPDNLEPNVLIETKFRRAEALLQYGDEAKAVEQYQDLLQYKSYLPVNLQATLFHSLGIAYLRFGERINCVNNHSTDACILPIQGNGIHRKQGGSREAIKVFESILKSFPDDYDSRWLLNIAYMTVGEYPDKVPPEFLIKGLNAESEYQIKPFEDMGAHLGLNMDNMAGGAIVEDFDNDGYLDLVTSAWGLQDTMHYYKNNGDGTFTDLSRKSGLSVLTGGLNMVSADYNNDGFMDFFILRGAWQGQKGFGEQPNSLIKNNGDGTFTDVTTIAGVLSFMPTQTATWNDFNRDGWVDLFVGNETTEANHPYPCELYINNQDGTFSNVAKQTGVEINRFVKGVTSGDFDNDGWVDIFISTQDSTSKVLLRNKGVAGKIPAFEDVTQKAGITAFGQTFGTWFWDYDNDGWLDVFMANYDFGRPLSYYAALEGLNPSDKREGKMFLYHNNRNGTFSEVAYQMNLNKLAFAMGNNFGDIDNDGWLDFYLGTGNPNYQSLVPNKFFKNMGGKSFADITTASRMGHLQKGHGVAFCDLDNDGDQDVYAEMGGAYRGDHYPSSFYLNPGQSNNNWIYLKLEGTTSNRAAIGARLELKFRDNGVLRSVFRDVNTGGSFGCSPLRREIGIGTASVIEEINIRWSATGKVQTIRNVKANQFLHIKEDQAATTPIALNVLDFRSKSIQGPMCKPDSTLSMK